MANIKASIKDIKKSNKKREANLILKNRMKKSIRELKDAVKAGADEAKLSELMKNTTQIIDKATKKKIIHKNNAARKKSKVSKSIVKK